MFPGSGSPAHLSNEIRFGWDSISLFIIVYRWVFPDLVHELDCILHCVSVSRYLARYKNRYIFFF